MPNVEMIRALFQQAFARQSRSTVMNPLAWLIAVLLAGLSASLLSHAPMWLIAILGIFLSISILIFLGLYLFFAFTSPDLLRSEKFYLTKMAIEKSARGDNLTGLIDPNIGAGAKLLEAEIVSPKEAEQ